MAADSIHGSQYDLMKALCSDRTAVCVVRIAHRRPRAVTAGWRASTQGVPHEDTVAPGLTYRDSRKALAMVSSISDHGFRQLKLQLGFCRL
jgi:hypothetical protein